MKVTGFSRLVVTGMAAFCASVNVASAWSEVSASGSYVQQATGMTFPMQVDDFQRDKILRYAEDGTDESAGYNRVVPLSEIVMTVYVFPSPHLGSFGSPQDVIDDARDLLCKGQFAAIQREITNAHPDAVLSGQGKSTLVQGNYTYNGDQASYNYTATHYVGRENVALRSDVYVFCFAGGKWTVEYRVDYPAQYDATQPVANFMRDLVWTIPPEK